MLKSFEIDNAKPREKPYQLADGLGLSLLVKPSGKRLWRFRYRFSGARPTCSPWARFRRSRWHQRVKNVLPLESSWPRGKTPLSSARPTRSLKSQQRIIPARARPCEHPSQGTHEPNGAYADPGSRR